MRIKNVSHKIIGTTLLLLMVCIINFSLFHLTPGDFTHRYFNPNTSKIQLENMRNQLALNEPLPIQFGIWVKHMLNGDLGYSWSQRRPVAEIMKEAVPATLLLTTTALLINLLSGSIAGMYSGIHWQNWRGKMLDTASLLIYTVPVFWLGLMAVLLFSVCLGWLPAGRMFALHNAKMSLWQQSVDLLQHLILPATVLGLSSAAGTARFVRGKTQEIMQQNYIRAAHAKGLPLSRIYIRHIFRNAMLPLVTLFGLQLPYLLSGAFIVEVIFAWPGMGRITYDAVFAKDFPVIMALNLIAAMLVIAGNFLADQLYKWVDPRVEIFAE